MMLTLLQRVRRRIYRDGLGSTLLQGTTRAQSKVHAFLADLVRGVSTEAVDKLPAMRATQPGNHYYVATAYSTFHKAIQHVEVRPGQDVFVDFGSGKGRIVLLAAALPFKRVIGVEYAAEVNAVAQANLEHARPKLVCQDVQLLVADATKWEVPDDATVLFFFNPFEGVVLAEVCANIRRSLARAPRRLSIIYVRPDYFFEREIAWREWLTRQATFRSVEGLVAVYEHSPLPGGAA